MGSSEFLAQDTASPPDQRTATQQHGGEVEMHTVVTDMDSSTAPREAKTEPHAHAHAHAQSLLVPPASASQTVSGTDEVSMLFSLSFACLALLCLPLSLHHSRCGV